MRRLALLLFLFIAAPANADVVKQAPPGAFVSLGDLAPDDVDVQVVHGRVRDEGDEIVDTTVSSLKLVESYEANRHRFDGSVTLGTTGSFGYTVRVLPHSDQLPSDADLALLTTA